MNALHKKTNLKRLLIFIVVLTVVFLGYTLYSKNAEILGFIKEKIATITQSQDQEKWVRGLEKIPIYPGSTFLFADDEKSQEVKNMLSEKRSAYLLPNGDTFSDAISFYKKELPEYGWQFVAEVDDEDATKKPGYYWVKEQDGLWIYEQIHDVWYQIITADQANSGLSELVAQESREYYDEECLLKLSDSVQTSWDFNYPDTWKPIHKNSTYSSGLDIVFKYTLGGFELRIQDLGRDMGSSLEGVTANYFDELNKSQPKSEKFSLYKEENEEKAEGEDKIESEEKSTDQSYSQIKLGEVNALEMVLVKENTSSKAYITIMQHPTNERFYAICNIIGDRDFYEYIKENIKPI